ncbi:MAG: isoprenylcysteine carboxylmethyltransferase family protein [Acidimicrobiaceae bacterium]|nr:isoprenylcysteine carboxylmethyltransferase family protein [Acidimicrobiaceae bacterium]
MHVADGVIVAGWVAFWIYWLAAAGGVKASRPRSSRFAGLRLVAIVLAVVLVRSHPFGSRGTTNDPWREAIGLALFAAGLGVAIWARRYLGRNWGMPMSQKVDPELITTGPYHRVRHPIYSGLLLAMIGTTIALSLYVLVVVAAIGLYFVYSAFMEERYMASRFPETYPAYKQSTRMLIPFIF